jgi:hypothetical protein
MNKLYITLILIITAFNSITGQSNDITSSNALHFDGANDYLQIQTMPPATGEFTVMTWLKLDATSTSEWPFYNTIACWGSEWGPYAWIFRVQGGKLCTNSSSELLRGNTTIPIDTWTHVALSQNNKSFKLYVNGQLDGSFTETRLSSFGLDNYTIGQMIYGGNLSHNPFQGAMDEFSLWNTELSQSSIDTYRQNGVVGNETGLVLYYNFNQGTASSDNTGISTIIDSSSNNYTASIKNMSLQGDSSNFILWGSKDSNLSVDNFSIDDKFFLFPNPTTDFIKVLGITNKESFTLYNIIGTEIKKGVISNNEQIDLRGFTNGLYFLKLKNGNSSGFIKK